MMWFTEVQGDLRRSGVGKGAAQENWTDWSMFSYLSHEVGMHRIQNPKFPRMDVKQHWPLTALAQDLIQCMYAQLLLLKNRIKNSYFIQIKRIQQLAWLMTSFQSNPGSVLLPSSGNFSISQKPGLFQRPVRHQFEWRIIYFFRCITFFPYHFTKETKPFQKYQPKGKKW